MDTQHRLKEYWDSIPGLPPFEKATDEQKAMISDTTVYKIYCFECAWNELKEASVNRGSKITKAIMAFCTITMTRGDRPQFLELCKHQLSRMTVKPDASYFIDYPPVSKEVDLIPRVFEGIRQASHDGFREIFIIEDDDYYPADYFTKMHLDGFDFVGCLETTYYHIRNKRYQIMPHSARSSLFMTGFKIGALEGFNWPARTSPYLDVALWNHAQRFKRHFVYPGAVGIKHGVGLCGGTGHWKNLRQEDPDMQWLKDHVDSEAYLFYKSL